MSMATAFGIIAALGALTALVLGIASMACDRRIAHHSSEEWMVGRVGCQAAALFFFTLGLLG